MIIGCTGNYRKEEYFIILERLYSILSKTDAEGFYEIHRSRPFFDELTSFMSSIPSNM